MSDHLFHRHLKNLGYNIEDKVRPKYEGIGFDILTTDPEGQKQYFTVIDKKEANEVYSPKGEINRKVDRITKLIRYSNRSVRFGIAVPNNNRYRKILKQKLQSIPENFDAYLIGDKVEPLIPSRKILD